MFIEREIEVDIGGTQYRLCSDDGYLEYVKNGFEPEFVDLISSLVVPRKTSSTTFRLSFTPQ